MHWRSFVWIEMVEQSYNDELWCSNFWVTKATFNFLLDAIINDISHYDTDMCFAILAEWLLEMTLYFLASTVEYRTIGNLFGVSEAFVCSCVRELCDAITKQLSNIIHFPQGNELIEVIRTYENKWHFPMCAGAIDGTYIPIHAPMESRAKYVNRKGYHSISNAGSGRFQIPLICLDGRGVYTMQESFLTLKEMKTNFPPWP